jgi:hypothetical protein
MEQTGASNALRARSAIEDDEHDRAAGAGHRETDDAFLAQPVAAAHASRHEP